MRNHGRRAFSLVVPGQLRTRAKSDHSRRSGLCKTMAPILGSGFLSKQLSEMQAESEKSVKMCGD
jgi:hypothetical protein